MTSIAEVLFTKHARTLYIPRGDEWIAPCMKSGKYWEESILNAMLKALPADGSGTYIDAGSFVGTHAIPMARAARHALAFEPQRHIFQMLCANAVANDIGNLWTFNAALGHRDHVLISMNGTVPDGMSRGAPLRFGTNPSGRAINYGGTNMGAGGDPAEMRTLDSVFEQLAGTRDRPGRLPDLGCDVLKVDVQGAEPLMFWGARATIARFKPTIFYEVDARFNVTPDMHAQLGEQLEGQTKPTIPATVATFDIARWAQAELGYSPPSQLGPCDWVLYRPQLTKN